MRLRRRELLAHFYARATKRFDKQPECLHNVNSEEWPMNVITRKRLREFAARHPDAQTPLEQWYRTVRKARWSNLQEVRVLYPHADAVKVGSGNVVSVFNVGGNKYRLATAIHYNVQRVYMLKIMTHSEYNKDLWKDQL
jgi:mRNA interferase HigB